MPTKFIENIFESSKIDESLMSTGIKKYIISGAFTVADKPNANKRVYPKEVLNSAISKIKEKVKQGRIKMSLDHPNFEGRLSDTAAVLMEITDIQEDGKAYYKAQIVDTTAGKDLKAIIDGGGVVGVSTRGYGNALHDQEYPGCEGKVTVIQPGFNLETIDFVDNPSVEETEENVTLEQKRSIEMKTLEELRKAYPEIFKDLDEKIASEKKNFEKKISELTENLSKITANFDKLAEAVKTVKPEMFTVVAETEVVKAKDEQIASLTGKISEMETKIKDSNAKLGAVESEKVKNARDMEIQTLKANDQEFFKYEALVKKFDNCNTAEEIKKVYESNKELLTAIKGQKQEAADPKTKVPEKKEEELTEAQKTDFNRKNVDRLNAGLSKMSIEDYKKKFC